MSAIRKIVAGGWRFLKREHNAIVAFAAALTIGWALATGAGEWIYTRVADVVTHEGTHNYRLPTNEEVATLLETEQYSDARRAGRDV
jgi:hypothetical protein